jgi:hypothetical protein
MNIVRSAIPILLAAGLAGSAAADPAKPPPSNTSLPNGQCIDTTMSDNWEALDDHTLLVRVVGRAYRVTTSRCPSLASPLPRITTVMRGGSRICDIHDAQLYVANSGDVISTPCFMESIEPITLEAARALEKQKR